MDRFFFIAQIKKYLIKHFYRAYLSKHFYRASLWIGYSFSFIGIDLLSFMGNPWGQLFLYSENARISPFFLRIFCQPNACSEVRMRAT